jgi:hypothetical protein
MDLLFEVLPLAPEKADQVVHSGREIRVSVLKYFGIATLSLNGVLANVMPRSSRKARNREVRRAMRRPRTRWMAVNPVDRVS